MRTEQAVVSDTEPLVPGFLDRFGDRVRLTGRGSTDVEILRLRPELTASPLFELAVRRRADQLAGFVHPHCARVRQIGRLPAPDGRLLILSDAIDGWRLSEVLEAADQCSVAFHPDAVLFLLRQLLGAVASLHEVAPGISHGALGTERLVVTAEGRVVITESVLGGALRHLPTMAPDRLWRDLRLVVAAGEAQPFGRLTDLRQIGIVALSLALGRQLRRDEYPTRLASLLQESAPGRPGLGAGGLGPAIRGWLGRVLCLTDDLTPWSVAEARRELNRIVEADPRYTFAPTGVPVMLGRVADYYAAAIDVPVPTCQPPAPADRKPGPVLVRPPEPAPREDPPAEAIGEPAVPPPPEPVAAESAAPAPLAHTPQLAADVPHLVPEATGHTPEVLLPALVVLPPVLEVRQPVLEVRQPALEVRQPVLEVRQPALEVRQPALEVRQPALEILPPALEVPPPALETLPPALEVPPPVPDDSWPEPAVRPAVDELLASKQEAPPDNRPDLVFAEAPSPFRPVENPSRPSPDAEHLQAPPLAAPYSRPLFGLHSGEGTSGPVAAPVHTRARTLIGVGAAALVIVALGGYAALRPSAVTTAADRRASAPSQTTVPGTAGEAAASAAAAGPRADAPGVPSAPRTQEALPAAAAPERPAPAGTIEVVSPLPLNVSEGGRALGTSGSPIQVSAGRHTLAIGREDLGYQVAQVVDVKPGQPQRIQPVLPSGVANLNATPWAEVWIDGRKVGETPLGGVQLTIGPHEVQFRHPELGDQTRTLMVTTGGVTLLSVELKK
jgi:hypothetical protein